MVNWEIVYTKQAVKDSRKIVEAGLKDKVEYLLGTIASDPFKNPPTYEKLVGNLSGAYSRRINIQHRLVYQVFLEKKIIRVLRMWTHYE